MCVCSVLLPVKHTQVIVHGCHVSFSVQLSSHISCGVTTFTLFLTDSDYVVCK